MKWTILFLIQLCILQSLAQNNRRVGKFREVFAWKQLSFNINGNILNADRLSSEGLTGSNYGRKKRQSNSDFIYFSDDSDENSSTDKKKFPGSYNDVNSPNFIFDNSQMIQGSPRPPTGTEDASSFFIQYNNVPMGAEKHGNRLFIALPRRRYGIPATLNTVDLSDRSRSPALKPYPNLEASRALVSVYRTRVDSCNRLWMVDTGLLELPVNPQQLQQPAIVVYDLNTDRQIMKYELKNSDVPANNTPTGLASIAVDTSKGCSDTYAYIPDLTTNGIVVFSLRERDSWRLTHNYFHFNPAASNLNIAGHRFQWNDGIFSLTLAPGDTCRTAYFHPMISTQEFSVSTCTLNNRTAPTDGSYWERYTIMGDRGPNTQSTSHDLHQATSVIFYADIGRDGVSCWNTGLPMNPQNVVLLAQDAVRMSYPSDLHVTDDEVWVITNTLPRFGYSQLDTTQYNFYIYRANVYDLISGTRCEDINNI